MVPLILSLVVAAGGMALAAQIVSPSREPIPVRASRRGGRK